MYVADLIELLTKVPGAMEHQLEVIAQTAQDVLTATAEWLERHQ